jgi:hypothetical protein
MAIDAGVKQFLTALRMSLRRWLEPRRICSKAAGPDAIGSRDLGTNSPSTDGQTTTALARLGETRGQGRPLKNLMTKLQARKQKPRYQPDWEAAAFEAGDFSIDLATRSVVVRGQELQLTSAEFEMLVFLIGHQKSVVTPNTMLTTNWSGREVRQAEFVRVLISLRKKLDSVTGSTPSYIRTESWIFYNFSPTLAHRV